MYVMNALLDPSQASVAPRPPGRLPTPCHGFSPPPPPFCPLAKHRERGGRSRGSVGGVGRVVEVLRS